MRRRLVLAGLGACVCAAAGVVFHTTIARNHALKQAPRALEATDPLPPPGEPQLHLTLIDDEFRIVNDAGDILAYIPVLPEEGMFGSRATLVDAPDGQRLVVGAPFAHTVAPSAGSVWWFDHADLVPAAGATAPVRIEPALATLVLDGAGDGSLLGAGLKMIPDANADGAADVLVGAPGDGLAYLLSGADGTVIRTLEGSRPEGFGAATALGRDETGDGVREHLVASLFLDPAGNTRARRWTFDGATGDLVTVDETPDAPIARYAGDLDGDNAVTDADLTRVLLSVGAIAPTGTLEDINGDAIVDESDVNLVLRDYGEVIEPIGDLTATGGIQHPCMWIWYYIAHPEECAEFFGGGGGVNPTDTGTGDDPDGTGDGGGGNDGGGGSGGSGGTNTGGGWDGSDGGTSGSGGGSCDGLYGPSPGAYRIVDRGASYIFNQPHTPDTCVANWQVQGGTATPLNADLTIAEVVFGEVGEKIVSTGCTCQNSYIVTELPIALDAPAIPHPEADQPPFHIVLVNNDNEDAEAGTEADPEVFDFEDFVMSEMDDDLVPLTIGPPEHIGNARFKHGTIRWRLDTVGVRVWYRKSDLYLHDELDGADGPPGNPILRTIAGEDYIVVPDAWITHALTEDLTLYVEALEPSVTLGDQSVTYKLNAKADWQVPGSQESVEYEVNLTNAVQITAATITLHDLRYWEPHWNTAQDTIDFDQDDPDDALLVAASLVGGAITDGTSLCMARVIPAALGQVQGSTLRVIRDGYEYLDLPNVVGVVSSIDPNAGIDGQSPLLPLGDAPQNDGLSSEIPIPSGCAFYIPPTSYLDARHNSSTSLLTLSDGETTQMQLEYVVSGDVAASSSFLLRRPPIVLVHGLMGSAQNYWGAPAYSESVGFPVPTRLYYADYEATNTAGYPENFKVVRDTIAEAIGDYRNGNDGNHHLSRGFQGVRYAATRADVVAHSMGGQVTRLFLSSIETDNPVPRAFNASATPAWRPIVVLRWKAMPGNTYDYDYYRYLRSDNYGAGDIRRFIPIGSPFKGSPIANTVAPVLEPTTFNYARFDLALQAARVFSPSLEQKMADLLFNGTTDPRNYRQPTAVQDLAVGSDMQTMLEDPMVYPTGRRRVAWHPMVGIATVSAGDDLTQTALWELLFTFTPLIDTTIGEIEPLSPVNSDLVVSQWSQRNAFGSWHAPNSQFPAFRYHIHTFDLLANVTGVVQETDSDAMSWAGSPAGDPVAPSVRELLSVSIGQGNMLVGNLH